MASVSRCRSRVPALLLRLLSSSPVLCPAGRAVAMPICPSPSLCHRPLPPFLWHASRSYAKSRPPPPPSDDSEEEDLSEDFGEIEESVTVTEDDVDDDDDDLHSPDEDDSE